MGSRPRSTWARSWTRATPRTELIEDNNAKAGSRIGIGPRADFIVTAVTGPASAQPGQTLTAQVTVCNQGTQPGGTDVEAYVSSDTSIRRQNTYGYMEDFLLGTVATPVLAPGQCTTLPISGPASSPPSSTALESAFYVGAIVDPRNTTPELIEDNNALAGSRIGIGFRADFVVTSVTGPTSVRPGATFSANVTVCNRGQSADIVDVELYFSADTTVRAPVAGQPLEDFPLGRLSGLSLPAGVCSSQAVTLTAYVPSPGSYYLGAIADPFNNRLELIEDNNALTGALTSVVP